MSKKILHIASCDRFVPPFVDEITKYFNYDKHDFLLTSGPAETELVFTKNVYFFSGKTLYSKLSYYLSAIVKMHQADKVILHGLFNYRLIQVLFFFPWLLKKCYWMIWGADLYSYQIKKHDLNWKVREFFRRSVIKNIGHLVTYIEEDVALARKWYGATGEYHECILYRSNLYKDYQVPKVNNSAINIQVGNSADVSNNHVEVLQKLLPYKDENIKIHVPLSYGSKEYAQQVILQGREWFGEKFNAITELMSFQDYLAFLGNIDIAIFNHRRQQGMGNTITLLGLGKTVYLRSDTAQWKFFEDRKIAIKDTKDFKNLDFLFHIENVSIVKEYFSEKNYRDQLTKLFL